MVTFILILYMADYTFCALNILYILKVRAKYGNTAIGSKTAIVKNPIAQDNFDTHTSLQNPVLQLLLSSLHPV